MVGKIQNGGRCHGNQGAKNVKFGVNLTFFAPWLPWQRPPF
jgi:ribosomal protein L35AE/L33A